MFYFFWCSDFDHFVAKPMIYAVVASYSVKIDDVLKVPTHQNSGIFSTTLDTKHQSSNIVKKASDEALNPA
jgi:hypothetical protein